MPNWCDTTYKISGDKKDVQKLARIAKYSLSDRRKNSGWTGYFIDKLKDKNTPKETIEFAYQRGWIIDWNLDVTDSENPILTLFCAVAWGENPAWRDFIEEKLNVNIEYLAIEPGCQVFLSNSDEYANKYQLSMSSGVYYLDTEEEVLKTANEHSKDIQFKTFEEFEHYLNYEDTDITCYYIDYSD